MLTQNLNVEVDYMIRKGLFVVIGLLFLFTACSNQPNIDTNMSKDVMDFEFTNQDNETVTLDDLKGEWWIADFIFTNCTTICLPMTSNMTKLQDMVNDANLEGVKFISFSVEPDYDTPEVLTEYAEGYSADLNTWNFLTGYDFETIQEMSVKSFQSLLQEPPPGEDQVIHGTSFFLVDPEGTVVKRYDGVKTSSMDEILADLEEVL